MQAGSELSEGLARRNECEVTDPCRSAFDDVGKEKALILKAGYIDQIE